MSGAKEGAGEVSCASVLADLMQAEIRAGITFGSQLWVWHDGVCVADLAIGEKLPGQALGPQHMFNMVCGLKPVVAVACVSVCEQQSIDLHTPIAQVLDVDARSRVSIADVLSHDAGLAEPRAHEFHFMNDDQRHRALDAATLLRDAAPGTAAYSEIAGWYLLTEVVAALSNEPVEGHLRRGLDQFGGGEVAFAFEPGQDVDDRVATYVVRRGRKTVVPLLHDLTDRFARASAFSCVSGGYASARGLGRFLVRVLERLRNGDGAHLPSARAIRAMTETSRSGSVDQILGRACSFGYGFMTDLSSHGFSASPSPLSFGNAGFLGNSFAFVDPQSDVVVSYVNNTLPTDVRMSIESRRRFLVEDVYSALARAAI